MKENRMHDSGRLKGSVRNAGRPRVLSSIASRENRVALVAIGVAMVLVLLSGCASVSAKGDSNPWYYNSDNGRWLR